MNIFAPITASGGSINVVRISGSKVLDVMQIFGYNDIMKPNQAKLINLYYKNEIFDSALVTYFKAPNSFTGEDVLEFSLHGSSFILRKFLDILSSIPNFCFADNGEFSKRALLNGKMNLIQCEGINALIKSESFHQHKLASQMLCGNISSEYEDMRDKIITILSKLESNIDFAEEEDVPKILLQDIQNLISNLSKKIDLFLQDENRGQKILNGVTVAICGGTNVGKSSILNYLAKRELAIVSDIAGTTRDSIEVSMKVCGYQVILFDTAGIRATNDIIEQKGIDRAHKISHNADIVLLIIDVSQDINIILDNISTFSINKNQYFIIILNKIDLISDIELADLKKKIYTYHKTINIASISINNNNITELNKEIEHILYNHFNSDNIFIFNERHRILLQKVYQVLNEIEIHQSIEILSDNLRYIANMIGEITGKIYTDDILDNIFSKFCIGK